MKIASIQVEANDLKDYKTAMQKLLNMVEKAAYENDLIIVPEAAFPAYFLGHEEGNLTAILEQSENYLNKIKEIAISEKSYIAYGYAEKEKDNLYNTAVLLNRDGVEIAKKRKSFLWHFDSNWFTAGEETAIVDTEFGRIALVVCADARMPEIIRLAALEGAELIIDLANLTATGPDISELHNAQSAYMLSARALENQVWLAVSDKWGVEANTITYAGRSSIFAPDGTCLIQASSDKDEIISAEIPCDSQGRVKKTEAEVKFYEQRKPNYYKTLTSPIDSLPIVKYMKEPLIPANLTPFVIVAAGYMEEEYLHMIRRMVNQGSTFIVMPPNQVNIEHVIEELKSILPFNCYLFATTIDNSGGLISYMITNEGIRKRYSTIHSESTDEVNMESLVFETKWGRVAIMHGVEGMMPEWSRTLMLLGADCIIWPNQYSPDVAIKIARTRAAENRIYIISSQSSNEHGNISQIIDPNGVVIASTIQSLKKHACGVLVPFVNSRIKDIVPGTNVVLNRNPQNYGRLIK
ncbi:carbon-nitrogen hydrolase family protein [Bacillus timonensis]|uniref:Carbon-nitrogen hydrolase family protein n=1 Tax=Bacillus timonensis TaxID=1033734 RepID=A0A4S3PJR3_9BACI|nr:carbon-nitrogen hydrolase family protein [Bacillus timonensis]THE09667.1 carbon-nitrogen hydrolase family protein [Bacillus timonensis]